MEYDDIVVGKGICPKCGEECYLLEYDDGYPVERGYYHVYIYKSDCCLAEVE